MIAIVGLRSDVARDCQRVALRLVKRPAYWPFDDSSVHRILKGLERGQDFKEIRTKFLSFRAC